MKRPLYNAIHSLIFNQRHFVTALFYRLGGWIPDRVYLKILFWLETNEKLDLDNPITYNQKLQWLKLYNQHPIFTTMVDKLKVKKMVAEIIGDEYVIPVYGSWSSTKEIDWASLPNQFVIKTNHDGGNFGVIICKDKSKLDYNKAIRELNQSLRRSSFLLSREWPYKNIERRIFAEQYLEDKTAGELLDYKFFCFNGKPEYLYVASNRQNKNDKVRFDYFDMDFQHLDLNQSSHQNALVPIEKPSCFEEMKVLAEKLASIKVDGRNIPHVRVDLYQVNGKVYFGEYTFFHLGGLARFYPNKYDEIFGELIKLPEKHIESK